MVSTKLNLMFAAAALEPFAAARGFHAGPATADGLFRAALQGPAAPPPPPPVRHDPPPVRPDPARPADEPMPALQRGTRERDDLPPAARADEAGEAYESGEAANGVVAVAERRPSGEQAPREQPDEPDGPPRSASRAESEAEVTDDDQQPSPESVRRATRGAAAADTDAPRHASRASSEAVGRDKAPAAAAGERPEGQTPRAPDAPPTAGREPEAPPLPLPLRVEPGAPRSPQTDRPDAVRSAGAEPGGAEPGGAEPLAPRGPGTTSESRGRRAAGRREARGGTAVVEPASAGGAPLRTAAAKSLAPPVVATDGPPAAVNLPAVVELATKLAGEAVATPVAGTASAVAPPPVAGSPRTLAPTAPAMAVESAVPLEGPTASDRVAASLWARPAQPDRAPQATVVEAGRFVQRVAAALRLAHGQSGELRLRLSPPQLGSLTLEVKIQGGSLTARIEAENAAARSVLLENLPLLRDRLAEQGVRIENFDVDLLPRHGDAQPQLDAHGRHGTRRHRPRDEPLEDGLAPASDAGRVADEDLSQRPRQAVFADGRLNVII